MNRRDFIKGLFGLVAAGVAAKIPIEEQPEVSSQWEDRPMYTSTGASGHAIYMSYDGIDWSVINYADFAR